MSFRNRVNLIGRTGSEVELMSFENGTKKASVSLATNDFYMNAQGEKVEQTNWHQLIAFGKTAEVLKNHVFKGKEIAVEGKLVYRNYDTPSGHKKQVTEVRLTELILLS